MSRSPPSSWSSGSTTSSTRAPRRSAASCIRPLPVT
jgi:hypothetical protein